MSDSKSSSSLEEEEDEELFVAEVVPGDCNSPLVESGNLKNKSFERVQFQIPFATERQ